MKKRKRLIVDVDEKTFNEFKVKCRAMGVTMSEVVLLGLDAGLEKYAEQEINKLRKQQEHIKELSKKFIKKGDLE